MSGEKWEGKAWQCQERSEKRKHDVKWKESGRKTDAEENVKEDDGMIRKPRVAIDGEIGFLFRSVISNCIYDMMLIYRTKLELDQYQRRSTWEKEKNESSWSLSQEIIPKWSLSNVCEFCFNVEEYGCKAL